MAGPPWVPDAGDIVWLQFDPRSGHEQAGLRPALVLTPARYNQVRGMMVCCPMTSRIKGYAFEVVVSRTPPSAVLAAQVKNLDWRARGEMHKGVASASVLAEVRAKIKALPRLQSDDRAARALQPQEGKASGSSPCVAAVAETTSRLTFAGVTGLDPR